MATLQKSPPHFHYYYEEIWDYVKTVAVGTSGSQICLKDGVGGGLWGCGGDKGVIGSSCFVRDGEDLILGRAAQGFRGVLEVFLGFGMAGFPRNLAVLKYESSKNFVFFVLEISQNY